MAGPVAKLGGKPLLGESTQEWEFAAGTQPVIREFELLESDADALTAGEPRPVSLSLSDGQGHTVEIQNLYIVHRAPGEDPNIARVTVADRRFWWDRQFIKGGFNVRNRVGFRRIQRADVGEGNLQANPIVDEIAYKPWSLNGDGRTGRPWTAAEVLRKVLEETVQAEPSPGPFTVESLGDDIPIENLELFDNDGAAALDRILNYLPETTLRVDADGSVVVYSRVTAGELAQLEASGPEIVGGGHVRLIDYSRVRPSKIVVKFVPEIETRFDFIEVEPGATVARNPDQRNAVENVLPVPDFELELASGRKVPQGTWITVNEALDAWGLIPLPNTAAIAVTHTTIRRAFVPFMDLWSSLGISGTFDDNADWSVRIAALQRNYRQTYRLPKRWLDRFHHWDAVRVALLDPTTGTRGASLAYQDFSFIPTQRARVLEKSKSPGEVPYVVNVDGYSETIDESTRATPGEVRIEDHDQGIFRVEFLLDPLGRWEKVLPSKVLNPPTADFRGRESPVDFDRVIQSRRGSVPSLSPNHKVAVILTAVPASPNSDEGMYEVERSPQDIASLLPSAVRAGLSNANGPVMEVGIRAGMETARVAWQDGRASDIERAFGLSQGKANLSGLVVNAGDQAGVGLKGASLDSIADAAAARIYLSFADRHEGSKTTRLRAAARLDGFLDSITHAIAPDGAVTTAYKLATRGADVDDFALLDNSTRRVLLRLAHGSGA